MPQSAAREAQAGDRPLTLPAPPTGLLAPGPWAQATSFAPARELGTWAREAFILPHSPLHNPDHAHLRFARLAWLWTDVSASDKQRTILAQAETPRPHGRSWEADRRTAQLVGWFGRPLPDFLITVYAPWFADVDAPAACALVEHELYHCAQARDRWGGPRFTQEGLPAYTIRGHDVEEFVGVVRRYGAAASASMVTEMVVAATDPAGPAVRPADLRASGVCGTCGAGVLAEAP